MQLKSENSKLMKGEQLYNACCVKISSQKDDQVIFKIFCTEVYIICFLDSKSELLLSQTLESKLGTKLENKDTMELL